MVDSFSGKTTVTGTIQSRAERRVGGKGRAIWAAALGVAVVLSAAYWGTAGLRWSVQYHPDENPIAKWIEDVRKSGYVTARAYPGGWFELFKFRFWLEERAEKLGHRWEGHSVQDGRVNAREEASYVQRPWTPRKPHTAQDGRDFNVWLYVASAALVYAACLEAGLHPVGAFASALFFEGMAGPAEFAHYCETDEGLVFALAFFAWLGARTLRKRSWWLVLASGFAAGFAVACKFTLMPLLLWPLGACWVVAGRAGGCRGRRWVVWGLLVAGFLAMAAWGYVAGTPALRMSTDWYLGSLHRMSGHTYGEIERNLGGVYSWRAASVLRAGSLVRLLWGWGVPTLAWAAFSWAFWFRGRFRRQVAGLPALVPVFFPFFVFSCPFLRSQELLPLAVLFALGAGLPVEWVREWWAAGRPGGSRWWLAASAVVAGAAVALWHGAGQAAGMASCFQSRDTRAEAQNWLKAGLKAGTAVAFDSYVGQAARGVDCQAISMGGLPYCWEGRPGGDGTNGVPAYYVENEGFEGRFAIRSRKTGRLLPEALERKAAYEAAVLPLRRWAVSAGAPRPTFGQPPVRLVGLEEVGEGTIRVAAGYERPVLLVPDGAKLYGAEGLDGLGATPALHTVGKRGTVEVASEASGRWLVTRMLEGEEGAKIVREGLFKPKKSELPKGGAAAARWRPGWWERAKMRTAAYGSMRCRMRGDDQKTVCGSFLVRRASEAARALRQGGDAAGALALLEEAGEWEDEERVEAFLAASALGRHPEESWTEAARRAVEACGRLAAERESVGRTGAALFGIPLGVAEDFARARMPKEPLLPGWRLPLYLPEGRYQATVRIDTGCPGAADGVPPRLFEGQTEDFRAEAGEEGRWTLRAPIEMRRGGMLRTVGEEGDFDYFEAEVEVEWNPVERTLAAGEEIRRALERGDGTAG